VLFRILEPREVIAAMAFPGFTEHRRAEALT
jgi:hypothetical protein